ncbi:hypothetical protein TSOC_009761 [Tetrabaena socialis]|uniref:Uncharacterized protein n=1 Tax=Tetrabaena socialis TaxID=47790 RepID=A0A2J7ZV35_9CHLO|nr:hypothetical protein TSOC_009761 [Tetrabaena socialis]|eukprot:PNH04110.1 hypothetical protein TSOC_009761 [Tetrabaena socialis]
MAKPCNVDATGATWTQLRTHDIRRFSFQPGSDGGYPGYPPQQAQQRQQMAAGSGACSASQLTAVPGPSGRLPQSPLSAVSPAAAPAAACTAPPYGALEAKAVVSPAVVASGLASAPSMLSRLRCEPLGAGAGSQLPVTSEGRGGGGGGCGRGGGGNDPRHVLSISAFSQAEVWNDGGDKAGMYGISASSCATEPNGGDGSPRTRSLLSPVAAAALAGAGKMHRLFQGSRQAALVAATTAADAATRLSGDSPTSASASALGHRFSLPLFFPPAARLQPQPLPLHGPGVWAPPAGEPSAASVSSSPRGDSGGDGHARRTALPVAQPSADWLVLTTDAASGDQVSLTSPRLALVQTMPELTALTAAAGSAVAASEAAGLRGAEGAALAAVGALGVAPEAAEAGLAEAAPAASFRVMAWFRPDGGGRRLLLLSLADVSKEVQARLGRGAWRVHEEARGSEEATKMMRELSSRPVPVPGEVLSLGMPFLLNPTYSSLFVRPCYPLIYEALTGPGKPRKHILTGKGWHLTRDELHPYSSRPLPLPVSQSFFFYYLQARLVNSPNPPPYIVFQHMVKPDLVVGGLGGGLLVMQYDSSWRQALPQWCYDHGTGDVELGSVYSFYKELCNPESWYITDGVPPQLDSRAHILLITSPKRDTYKAMQKEAAVLLYMPPWPLDELLECRSKMYGAVPESLAIQLHQYYGGVARQVLGFPFEQCTEDLDSLVEELRVVVDSCNVAQVRPVVKPAICVQDMVPETSHLLLHIVPGNGFRIPQLMFSSWWVAEEIAKKAILAEKQGLASLAGITSWTFQDILYAAMMHIVLPQVWPAREPKRAGQLTLAVGSAPTTTARAASRSPFFVHLSWQDLEAVAGDNMKEGVYYRPASPISPIFDSFCLVDGVVHLSQTTVSGSKAVDAAPLNSVLTEMRLPADSRIVLNYLTPPRLYNHFKLKKAKADSWPPPAPKQPLAARTTLRVMKGVYALQVRALPAQGDRPMAGVRVRLGR